MGPIKPGDRFFLVRRSHSRAPINTDWITVTEVGRRWATFRLDSGFGPPRGSSHRFDLETFRLDGGRFSSTGRVYRSEAEYRDEVRAEALWSEFQGKIRYAHRPPDLTEIAILKAADALGIRLEAE